MEAVAVVAAGRIAGGRDRDALVGRDARAGELADDPAVGDLVIEHHRVAGAAVLADAAKAAPQRADARRAQAPMRLCSC